MRITIEYHAQARAAAGVASEAFELESPCTTAQLLARAGQIHGEPLKSIILAPDGRPHPSILLFRGDQQVRPDSPRALCDGDVVSVLSPIAGG